MFNFPNNSMKSSSLIFLLVRIKTPDMRFPIIVSIANQILNESHHMIIAESNPIIWKTAKTLKIIRVINKIVPTNFEFLLA
jgi:hypothetical protein